MIMEVRVRVEGRVQGVGFRAWTRRLANELGVRGWVRNLDDGSVEVHAAARADVIQEVARRLYEGPRGALVSRVTVEGPARDLPVSDFEIRL